LVFRRSSRILLATLAVAGLAALTATPAFAQITGNCSASINGKDVGSQGTGAFSKPIVVGKNAMVPVMMTAAGQISYLQVQISFAGFSWTVHKKPTTGTQWTSMVDVKKYAKYGVGLYKVTGYSGGADCSGSALIRVKGSPLSTVAGIVGLITALGGIGGALGAAALAMHSGSLGVGKSVLGLVAGLVGGVGLAVLLQQFGIVYPTRGVAIGFAAGGPAVSIGLGVLGKILGAGAAAAV